MTTEIKKAMNYMCADSSSVFPSWQVKRLKVDWIKKHTLLRGITNEGEIVVTPVAIATDYRKTPYLMDAITGSLYKDGKCKTSDHLKLLNVVEQAGLDAELMNKRQKALGG